MIDMDSSYPKAQTITRREAEILDLLSEGKTIDEIGTILGLAKGTVGAHVWKLQRKLDVHRTIQLVAWWIRQEGKLAA